MATFAQPLIEYLSSDQAAAVLGRAPAQLGTTEFARVRNLEYVYAPFELYPLAPHTPLPLSRVAAFAVDMDGTSTTTEPLALHALEYMVRRFTGLLDPAAWPGLDPHYDYPFVIGNSNFRHTEFLIERYGDRLDPAALRQAFFEALLWTLANLDDPQRRRDITLNAGNCGLADLLRDPEFHRLTSGGPIADTDVPRAVEPFLRRYGPAFRHARSSVLVSAALDIYYMRYHAILQQIERGEGERLSLELLGASGRRLIEPMPGYTLFVTLLKGWLGPDADALFEPLRTHLLADAPRAYQPAGLGHCRQRLAKLGTYFQRHPAKLALVTASIAHEAHAVMNEVGRNMAREVQNWPIPGERRELLAAKLADRCEVFDAFVNASDAHDARLKPHRDLYAIALFQMSIPKPGYASCVGLEDTEPGIVALRAAGVGCTVALPNRDTRGQNYAAAGTVMNGGLPELILIHNLLLDESCLTRTG